MIKFQSILIFHCSLSFKEEAQHSSSVDRHHYILPQKSLPKGSQNLHAKSTHIQHVGSSVSIPDSNQGLLHYVVGYAL